MRMFFVISLLSLASCSGPDQSSPQITSGDIAAQQEAKAFIQQSHSEISSSLQIQASELDSWKQDGLITQDEATLIQENL